MRVVLFASVFLLAGCPDDPEETTFDAAPAFDAAGGGIDAAAPDAMPVGGAPVASFTLTPDCTEEPTTEITATSTSTDPDGDTLTCTWVFQSSTNMSGQVTGCTITGITYPDAAPYPVTLTVDDGNGNTDMAVGSIGPCVPTDA